MTGAPAGEPTLADVQQQYPAWQCARGISGLYYGRHTTTGRQVQGEDPLDLRDQIKAAEARLAHGLSGPGGSAPGHAQL